jgi:hypothetical protein
MNSGVIANKLQTLDEILNELRLVDVVNNRLADFEQFRDEVLTYVQAD